MKLTVVLGNKDNLGSYSPRTYEFDTDSTHEALRKLADEFERYEGTRVPWPTADGTGPNVLVVEFSSGQI